MPRQCPQCSHEIPDGMKFCGECGYRASGVSSQSGVEADLSMGAVRTFGARPVVGQPAERSLGTGNTLTGTGGSTAPQAASHEPLSARYELMEEVGRGGFAVVFRGRDRKLGRVVAIKRLLPDSLKGTVGAQTLGRFHREAETIAALNHRNIVSIYDRGDDADGAYIVMEFVDGGTLRSYLKEKGKLPLSESLALARGIARGLAHAHRKNLVHRDIKPGNILLQKDGEEWIPKIVDFGLARAGSESELSLSGYGMGTPWYMPPEQRRDAKNINHTADLYALGKVLYEMVTGDVPDNVDPEKIPAVTGLSETIFKCIKTNPEERYFSADELLGALDVLEKGVQKPMAKAGKAGLDENACPACNQVNPPDVKFCEGCGTGLTRVCPECGRENSVHKKFCGACGTDGGAFLKAQEAYARIEQYLRDAAHSRVQKEAALVGELGFAPKRPKGQELLQAIAKARKQSEDAEKRRKELDATISAAFELHQAGPLEEALSAYPAAAGKPFPDAEALLKRATGWRALEYERTRLPEVEAALRKRQWQVAWKRATESPLCADDVDAEDRETVAELERQRAGMVTRISDAWVDSVEVDARANIARVHAMLQDGQCETASSTLAPIPTLSLTVEVSHKVRLAALREARELVVKEIEKETARREEAAFLAAEAQREREASAFRQTEETKRQETERLVAEKKAATRRRRMMWVWMVIMLAAATWLTTVGRDGGAMAVVVVWMVGEVWRIRMGELAAASRRQDDAA